LLRGLLPPSKLTFDNLASTNVGRLAFALPCSPKATMDELERVRVEAAKRRERASQLGLVDLVFSLYCDHLMFFEDDFKHEDGRVPQSVTKIVTFKIKDGRNETEAKEVFFGDRSYLFVFRQLPGVDPGGNDWTTGTIQVRQNGNLLFELYCTSDFEEYMGRVWKPFRVEAFLEGPWVDEVKAFAAQVEDLNRKQSMKPSVEQKHRELNDLKKRFGL
jgi:hypothetical protein